MLSDDYLVVLMGNHSRSERSNILYTGHRPYTEMPMWMKASDALFSQALKRTTYQIFIHLR